MDEAYDALDMESLFKNNLLKNDPSLHFREEQVHLAKKIVETITHGGTLIAEAGTGIGKSFSYLVPALLYANLGYKVIIVTATITLQHQLYDYDIPRLQRLLNLELPITVLKGRSNYLCSKRAKDFFFGEANQIFQVEAMEGLRNWINNTSTGDKEELIKHVNISQDLWKDIATDEYQCGGSVCSKRGQAGCFYLEARKRANSAGVVITNYSMLASHLRRTLQQEDSSSDNSLLPDDAIYILDEAHRLHTIIREGLVDTVSELEFRHTNDILVGKQGILEGAKRERGEFTGDILNLIKEYDAQFKKLTEQLKATDARVMQHARQNGNEQKNISDGTVNYRELMAMPDISNDIIDDFYLISKEIEVLNGFLSKLREKFENESGTEAAIKKQQSWWKTQQALAQQFSDDEQSSTIMRWCKYNKKQKTVSYSTVCLMVNDILQEHFFDKVPVSICTSATMTTFSNFEYWKRNTGVSNILDEVILPSPFPYKERVLFSIPTDAPEINNNREYLSYLKHTLPQILKVTEGRALVLCTSKAMVNDLGQYLFNALKKTKSNVLVQDGKYSNAALGKKFREDVHSVLVATSSFWEGFDAPGDTLRLLVLTRIPFTSPENLFFKEESSFLESMGQNSFFFLSLPQAEIRLRQGFGRLMRSHDDGGAIFMTDNRILSKRYGNKLMETLPACKTSFQRTEEIISNIQDHLLNL